MSHRTVYGALAISALALAVAGCGSTGTTAGAPRTASADAAFGPHYDGLVQRREAAGIPTMMDTMSSRVHFHPVLKVFANGAPIAVPANVGIDPRVDGMQMAGLHTHDATGTIHVEGVAHTTLGQFFAIWGVPFSASRLGPYRANARKRVRMWVNGKPSTAFGSLKLADRQQTVVSFGESSAPPPGAR